MTITDAQPPTQPNTSERTPEDVRKKARLLKGVLQLGEDLRVGDPAKAFQHALSAGIKLAGESVFYNPTVSPLILMHELKTLGIRVLAWEPETLMAAIDRKYGGWSDERIAEALSYFHRTGLLKTDVPSLVRQKIYALRILNTSDAPFTEWDVFEKIGSAFNDRMANFGRIEPLTAAECARTIALLDAVRADQFSNEVLIYIGTCCHESGLVTVAPLKWLAPAEDHLQLLNYEQTGERVDAHLKQAITEKFQAAQKNPMLLKSIEDDILEVQTAKLIAIDSVAQDALRV